MDHKSHSLQAKHHYENIESAAVSLMFLTHVSLNQPERGQRNQSCLILHGHLNSLRLNMFNLISCFP